MAKLDLTEQESREALLWARQNPGKNVMNGPTGKVVRKALRETLIEAGLEPRKRGPARIKFTQKDLAKIHRRSTKGESSVEIAKDWEVSSSLLRRRLREYRQSKGL